MSADALVARCECGACSISCSTPLLNSVCHCGYCRREEGGNAGFHVLGFKAASIQWVSGQDNAEESSEKLAAMSDEEADKARSVGMIPTRVACKSCKGLICTKLLGGAFISVPVVQIKEASISPLCHTYYASRAGDVDDKLPKFMDLPKELGGSGKMAEVN